MGVARVRVSVRAYVFSCVHLARCIINALKFEREEEREEAGKNAAFKGRRKHQNKESGFKYESRVNGLV